MKNFSDSRIPRNPNRNDCFYDFEKWGTPWGKWILNKMGYFWRREIMRVLGKICFSLHSILKVSNLATKGGEIFLILRVLYLLYRGDQEPRQMVSTSFVTSTHLHIEALDGGSIKRPWLFTCRNLIDMITYIHGMIFCAFCNFSLAISSCQQYKWKFGWEIYLP